MGHEASLWYSGTTIARGPKLNDKPPGLHFWEVPGKWGRRMLQGSIFEKENS
jgi:hypothetical protein